MKALGFVWPSLAQTWEYGFLLKVSCSFPGPYGAFFYVSNKQQPHHSSLRLGISGIGSYVLRYTNLDPQELRYTNFAQGSHCYRLAQIYYHFHSRIFIKILAASQLSSPRSIVQLGLQLLPSSSAGTQSCAIRHH